VVATCLFALDPNFLAHAPLVKNDVAMSLGMCALFFFLWRVGESLTMPRAVLLCLVAGCIPDIKLSGVAMAPMIALLLLLRVLLPADWPVLGRTMRTRAQRGVVACVLLVGMLASFWLCTWAAYRFRFSGTPIPGLSLDRQGLLQHIRVHQVADRLDSLTQLRQSDLDAWQPDAVTRLGFRAMDLHLLPEAWVTALLETLSDTGGWPSFLFGTIRMGGFWYYFPVVLLLKTPVSTLLAVAGAAVLAVAFWRKRKHSTLEWWTLACLAIPPLLYLGLSMRSHLNIGVRYELPVYPFAFVATGVVAAAVVRRWKRPAALVTGGLALALMLESLTAAPDFLSFFNAAVGGPRNGVRMLGDSNIDMGQDLPLVARWQKDHPGVNLYLAYFGMVDPAFYGIRYHALAGNYIFGPLPEKDPIQPPAAFAISVSNLQGLPIGSNMGDSYAGFRALRPSDLLGGSIAVFDVTGDAAVSTAR
jgi:hypothetical protein